MVQQDTICQVFMFTMVKSGQKSFWQFFFRYFAGGKYLDITISHGIGKTDVYFSVWVVVHATNQCPCLQFRFPATGVECQEIAADFMFRSKAGFDNCVGCIDGMLLWIEKPFLKECEKIGVDSGKI